MKKKKWIIISAAAAVIAAAVICFFVWRPAGGAGDADIYVESVAAILGYQTGSPGMFAGKVESQKILEIRKDTEREIQEIFVKPGDTVSKGMPLFAYDTEALEMQKQQAALDAESIDNDIAGYQSQIAALKAEKAAAPSDRQLEYTMQIQTLETSIKQAEYDKRQKMAEIDQHQKAIEQSTVTAGMDGVVREINETISYDAYGNERPFMTVMATGSYRVQGAIDEQSLGLGGLSEGQAVIVRSRVDEDMTWTGTVTEIDTEKESTEAGNMNTYDDSMSESATKYPFYVELDSTQGLLLGQHVLIEPDFGQSGQEGLWLDEGYIVSQDEKTYVWADRKGKLQLQEVEIGERNEETLTCQILSGLSEEDYIAWPTEDFREGMKTVKTQEYGADESEE